MRSIDLDRHNTVSKTESRKTVPARHEHFFFAYFGDAPCRMERAKDLDGGVIKMADKKNPLSLLIEDSKGMVVWLLSAKVV